MTELGDMMREIIRDYHKYIEPVNIGGAVYVRAMHYENPRSLSFLIKPFGTYKRIRKEYLVFRSYDNVMWEFHEIPF
jgi:hypothetical protein